MKQKYKYDILSLIIVVASLVILAVAALLIGNFGGEFGADLRETAQDTLSNQSNANLSTDFIANDTQKFGDNYFFWFLVTTFIGVIFMGLYLEFEPVTMVIIFVVGAIVVGMAWLGSSIYTGFADDMTGSSGMTKTNVLLNSAYFPIFIFVCLIILVVIMYNRKRPGEFQ